MFKILKEVQGVVLDPWGQCIAEAEQKNTLRQVIEWGDEPCEEHMQRIYRRQCPLCWAELSQTIEGKK